MGYTHFWYRKHELDPEKFKAAMEDAKTIRLQSKIRDIVMIPVEDGKEEMFSDEHLRFNGAPGCEHFRVERKAHGRSGRPLKFEFCKTDGCPYDLAVMCFLLIFHHHFGDDFKVCSNGKDKEWAPAFALVSEVLEYSSKWHFGPPDRKDEYGPGGEGNCYLVEESISVGRTGTTGRKDS